MAGLIDHQPGPKSLRKVWLSVMVEVYPLHKRHPDAGEFRLWSLLVRPDLSVRRIDDDISHGRHTASKKEPHPHPFTAQRLHQSWCIDGRIRDVAFNGV